VRGTAASARAAQQCIIACFVRLGHGPTNQSRIYSREHPTEGGRRQINMQASHITSRSTATLPSGQRIVHPDASSSTSVCNQTRLRRCTASLSGTYPATHCVRALTRHPRLLSLPSLAAARLQYPSGSESPTA
jgi:hypothetical protein